MGAWSCKGVVRRWGIAPVSHAQKQRGANSPLKLRIEGCYSLSSDHSEITLSSVCN